MTTDDSHLRGLLDPPRHRLVRFAIVGAVAATIQTALLWLFVDRVDLYYLLAAPVAIEITIVLQYAANNAWTFRRIRHRTREAYLRGLVRTNVVRGSAIPIQTGLLYAFVTWSAIDYLVANGVAIVLSGVYRYLLETRWTWQG